MSKIKEAVVWADEIAREFEEVVEGMYSDDAYLEIVEMAFNNLNNKLSDVVFFEHVEFVFGFDKKNWESARKAYKKRMKDLA